MGDLQTAGAGTEQGPQQELGWPTKEGGSVLSSPGPTPAPTMDMINILHFCHNGRGNDTISFSYAFL